MRGRFCFWPSVHSLTHLDQCQMLHFWCCRRLPLSPCIFTSLPLPLSHFHLCSYARWSSILWTFTVESASMFNSVDRHHLFRHNMWLKLHTAVHRKKVRQLTIKSLWENCNRLKMSDIVRTRHVLESFSFIILCCFGDPAPSTQCSFIQSTNRLGFGRNWKL